MQDEEYVYWEHLSKPKDIVERIHSDSHFLMEILDEP